MPAPITPEEEAAATAAFERDMQRLKSQIAETAPEVAPAPHPPAAPLPPARDRIAQAKAPEFKTRADLARNLGFDHLSVDGDGNPCVWMNHYTCRHCDHSWSDDWSSKCDDRCPMCSTSTTPDGSDWLGPKDGSFAVWDSLPEAGLPTGISTEDRQLLDAMRDDDIVAAHKPVFPPQISVFSSREAKDEWERTHATPPQHWPAPFPPPRHIDPMAEAVWLAQQAVAKAREAGSDMETLFHAVRLYEEEAEMQNELVDRCAPRWAWDVIDQALEAVADRVSNDVVNTDSLPFPNPEVGESLTAMITACERADDVPISRAEARRIREAGL